MINEHSPKTVSSHCYEFHGIRCEVYTNENTLKFYRGMPWRFKIWKPDGTEIRFTGVPNYCTSKRSAMMRAMARCKWIADGTYDSRYR
jgi:hypothetical protein